MLGKFFQLKIDTNLHVIIYLISAYCNIKVFFYVICNRLLTIIFELKYMLQKYWLSTSIDLIIIKNLIMFWNKY